MIYGIGVDLVQVTRIERAVARHGDRFLARVFTAGEIAYCRDKSWAAAGFALRFAAKEAVSKALSTGWAGDFAWKDVEVTNDPSGQPRVTLNGRLRERLAASSVFLSISHSADQVVAGAVIEDLSR